MRVDSNYRELIMNYGLCQSVIGHRSPLIWSLIITNISEATIIRVFRAIRVRLDCRFLYTNVTNHMNIQKDNRS